MLISKQWDFIIDECFGIEKLEDLLSTLDEDRLENNIYPERSDMFKAFELTSFDDIKLVIIGQDPYYNPGQANGLAFSVKEGVKLPASLKNIFKELQDDLGFDIPQSGDLTKWAKQGVLLLNSSLSVEEKKPNSHLKYPWHNFTDSIIKYISDHKNHVVFFLWGNFAIKKSNLIDSKRHLVLKSSHPSLLSARHSFFGSKVFSRANKYFKHHQIQEIDWSLK
ncbi:MAG: uracil-DNA glycosylase [Tissierellia bacterium]|nr:uracil-DNA glycosylase [Tissierellia bacterium]